MINVGEENAVRVAGAFGLFDFIEFAPTVRRDRQWGRLSNADDVLVSADRKRPINNCHTAHGLPSALNDNNDGRTGRDRSDLTYRPTGV